MKYSQIYAPISSAARQGGLDSDGTGSRTCYKYAQYYLEHKNSGNSTFSNKILKKNLKRNKNNRGKMDSKSSPTPPDHDLFTFD